MLVVTMWWGGLCFYLVVKFTLARDLTIYRHPVQGRNRQHLQKVEFIEENLDHIRKLLEKKDKLLIAERLEIDDKDMEPRNGGWVHDDCVTFKKAVETLKEGTKQNKQRIESLTVDLKEARSRIADAETQISDTNTKLLEAGNRVDELEALLSVGARAIDERNLEIFDLTGKLKRYEVYKDILADILEQIKRIHDKDFDLNTFMERVSRSLNSEELTTEEFEESTMKLKNETNLEEHIGDYYEDDLEQFINYLGDF